MPLTDSALQNLLRMILKGEHYRNAVVNEISNDFLRFTVNFFKDIAYAKLEGIEVAEDWYEKYFLGDRFKPKEMKIYAGLNDKTLTNIYGSASQKVILSVAPIHYDDMMQRVASLIDREFSDLRIALTIRYNEFSVELNLRETFIVVNTLGIKHAQIRGGAWSGLGKKLELPLMLTMANLYRVPKESYKHRGLSKQGREVDFHFFSRMGRHHRCEVKLMGKGNPESVDSSIARDSGIFIADTLSNLNKSQLDERDCHWVELSAENGYQRMFDVLQDLGVPSEQFTGDLDAALDSIIPEAFRSPES